MSARQLELFGGWGRREIPDRNGPVRLSEGARCDEAHQTPASDSRVDRDPRQDRGQHSPQVGRGPVGETSLAQALGNTPAPFDFAAHPDPNTTPQPDRPIPAWLTLPGLDETT